MQLPEILARNARMYPDDTALAELDPQNKSRRTITWKEFYQKANQIANGLVVAGIKKGDRVGILMTNCLEWLPVYFGILRAGAVAVPLNFRFHASDITRCLGLCNAGVLFFGEGFEERVFTVKQDVGQEIGLYIYTGNLASTPDFAVSLYNWSSGLPTREPGVDISITDPAAIYFTSGTTGSPKGVFLLHRNLEAAAYIENRHHNQTRKDNFLCIPPLYHTGAKMHWFGNFIVGAPAVLLKGTRPEWILDAVSKEKATIVWLLVPWIHDILVAIENREIDLDQYDLSGWRLMHSGAQPVPPGLIRRWKKFFPWQQYDTNYGLTEATGPGCIHLGMENDDRVGALGKEGFDWECRIVDDELNDIPCNTPGELLVRGPGVMLEYYRNPEATREALVDGWLRTGDIVTKDKDGFYWHLDRKKDVIICGGENIFPVEIENFIMEHDDVLDAAVIGLPEERLGEVPAAIVSPKPGRSIAPEDILDHCEQLPRYKRPRKVFIGEVLRNPTGKIEKPRLREIYGKSA